MNGEPQQKVRSAAHDLSEAALGGALSVSGRNFVDAYGRTVLLRGLNVSAISKLPTKPNGLSHLSEGFFEHRSVSFVGRPFPLEEAPRHFARLREWGLTFIRLLVTWESLEHEGPGKYDEEYIDYLRKLLEMMPTYGIKCFVCAHQDVWSRFSGGSGAPGWTFEAAGLDKTAFRSTGAAYVHNLDSVPDPATPRNEREPSGPFVWPSGYQKLAAATMATLFWAGGTFAWKFRCQRRSLSHQDQIEEVSIQEYLQGAYIEAFGKLADALTPLEACVGFELMNEPHRGYINLHSFHKWNYETDLHIGHYPSLLQSLALGSGYAQKVPYYVKSWPFPTRISHYSEINPGGRSAWLAPSPAEDGNSAEQQEPRGMGTCIWRAHGVWEWDRTRGSPQVLRNDYFTHDPQTGKEVEWYRDFYAPLAARFAKRTTKAVPSSLFFVEPIPNEFMPPWAHSGQQALPSKPSSPQTQTYAVKTVIDTPRPGGFVYAPHFYDLNVLFSKVHSFMSVNVQGLSRGMFILKALYFGEGGLRKNYLHQLRTVAQNAYRSLGEVPIVVGEVGIPYDINGAHAFRTGDYSSQRQLMDALVSALEENLLSFTLWNYNADNFVEHGDGWNNEDFSVYSADPHARDGDNVRGDKDELYAGGRVLGVMLRPYAAKVAGVPISTSWSSRTLSFHFRYSSNAEKRAGGDGKSAVTEIYVPRYHYEGREVRVRVSDGSWRLDGELQTLYVTHTHEAGSVHDIWLSVAGGGSTKARLPMVVMLPLFSAILLTCALLLARGT